METKTYEGSLQAYAVRQFDRAEGDEFVIVKPKGGNPPKCDYVATYYDEAQTKPCWLLRNNTTGNVKFEVEIRTP